LPKQITLKTTGSSFPAQNDLCQIEIDSVGHCDKKHFTEESFKNLGRDFIIVNVLPDGQQEIGKTVYAAPQEARVLGYQKVSRWSRWGWERIGLCIAGFIFILTAGAIFYRRRLNSKSR
jgi:hypothetical protein